MALLLGYDVGSSSVKATLLKAETGRVVAAAVSPETELAILAERPGWAEQDPAIWWQHIRAATGKLKAQTGFIAGDVKAIGISYQMHGLVIVDRARKLLRPAIIWCDSRAVEIGRKAAEEIGEKKCLKRLLNLPGNFTASKLRWVKENEPQVYSRIYKMMLPGDYIAMKMTGEIKTTPSGLSEAILWDFAGEGLGDFVLADYGIDAALIPEMTSTFCVQGELTTEAAEQLGLNHGTKVAYRAGDQPNNAFSVQVLEPGEVAVTAGTSGVVYAVTEQKSHDELSRVNVFVHVNHTSSRPRFGVLLCLNGAGILNRWLKENFADAGKRPLTYERMNQLAGEVPVGSEGLVVLPYGNGAERTLRNKDIEAAVCGWNFNVHTSGHFFRASQEGVAFALNYGLEIMRNMKIELKTARAGNANMFLSPVFAEAFATVTGIRVELYNTDGSQGAARGAGVGVGIYENLRQAFAGLNPVKTVEPDAKLEAAYQQAYERWRKFLEARLEQ